MKRFAALVAAIVLICCSAASAEVARYLETNGSAAHAAHLAIHLNTPWCRISGRMVNVRSEPGNGDYLGHVDQADQVELLELDGVFAKVRVTYSAPHSTDSFVGLTGWIRADYLECICTAEEYKAGVTHEVQGATITAGNTLMRELPSFGGRALMYLKKGTQVTALSPYTGDGVSWYRIALPSGANGFVRANLVLADGTIPLPEPEQPAQEEEGLRRASNSGGSVLTAPVAPGTVGFTRTKRVNVRSQPDIRSHHITQLKHRGTMVTILDTVTNAYGEYWYHVQLTNGTTGYIRADLISAGPTIPTEETEAGTGVVITLTETESSEFLFPGT